MFISNKVIGWTPRHGIVYNSSASRKWESTGFRKICMIFTLFSMVFHAFHNLSCMISPFSSTIWDKSSASYACTLAKNSMSELYALYSMHCIQCTVCYALNYIRWILCIEFHEFYSMHFILYIAFYALYSMHFGLCIVFYALYSLYWILCIVFYVLNSK